MNSLRISWKVDFSTFILLTIAHPKSSPSFLLTELSVLKFLSSIKYNWCCPYTHGCMAISLSLLFLLGSYNFSGKDGTLHRSLLHVGVQFGLILCGSCAHYQNYCEFLSVPVLSIKHYLPVVILFIWLLHFYLLLFSDPWTLWVSGMM